MKATSLSLATSLFLATLCYAQCDPVLFKKLGSNPGIFNLLKRYSIQVRQIPGAPFLAQYSYVLTKGTYYSFHLEPSKDNQRQLEFVLTNSDGEVLNDQLTEYNDKGNNLLVYKCRKTGIYYLNVHSPESFDGCAVLQLAFHRPNQVISRDTGEEIPGLKGQTRMKEYFLEAQKKSRFTYVFTKGTRYLIFVPDKGALDQDGIKVLDSSKRDVTDQLTVYAVADGVVFQLNPELTGIYYMDFRPKRATSATIFKSTDRATPY